MAAAQCWMCNVAADNRCAGSGGAACTDLHCAGPSCPVHTSIAAHIKAARDAAAAAAAAAAPDDAKLTADLKTTYTQRFAARAAVICVELKRGVDALGGEEKKLPAGQHVLKDLAPGANVTQVACKFCDLIQNNAAAAAAAVPACTYRHPGFLPMTKGVYNFLTAMGTLAPRLRNDLDTNQTPVEVAELPAGVNWMNDSGSGKPILYVRDCYPILWNMIRERFKDKEKPNVLIRGTPGVGKSYFLFYVIWQLRREGVQPIVVHTHNFMTLFHPDGTIITNETIIKQALGGTPGLVYLVDGVAPHIANVPTLLVTSPERAVWKHFENRQSANYFMPTVLFPELDRIRAAVWPQVTTKQLREVYKFVGGTIRRSLWLNERNPQTDVDELIDRCDLTALVARGDASSASNDSKGAGGSGKAVSHSLIHMNVKHGKDGSQFSEAQEMFASKYIQSRVRQRLVKEKRSEFRELVEYAHDHPYHALRGMVFEDFAHPVVAAAKSEFTGRQLVEKKYRPNELKSVTLPELKESDFADITELKADMKTYARPLAANYGAVDAVAPGNYCVQMTVSKKHHISWNKFNETIQRCFGANDTVRLYFVVPTKILKYWKYEQKFTHNRKRVHPADAARIEQWFPDKKTNKMAAAAAGRSKQPNKAGSKKRGATQSGGGKSKKSKVNPSTTGTASSSSAAAAAGAPRGRQTKTSKKAAGDTAAAAAAPTAAAPAESDLSDSDAAPYSESDSESGSEDSASDAENADDE